MYHARVQFDNIPIDSLFILKGLLRVCYSERVINRNTYFPKFRNNLEIRQNYWQIDKSIIPNNGYVWHGAQDT